jgi:hypothetical protein
MILKLLGPGLHWGKSQDEFLEAIDEARRRDRKDVAQHLEIMLERRNAVMFESPKRTPSRSD